MIPLKLQLKNFLSYGSETQSLDFEPYHMICLSGKNGHGKSALLDALTWVLWGQARKVAGTSKADDGLIRLNQNHMMVCFDFKCNNIMYRVRREYTLHQNKAMSHLDFGIINPETQQLQSLSDKTIRGTQEKINSCLGLDYDAFINSAFLRQGQSNEFSKRSARERKEILASILGLERYEILRRKALDALRVSQQEKDNLTTQQTSMAQEINNKNTIIEQLNVLQNQLQEITQQETGVINEYQRVESALNEAMQQKNSMLTQQALYDQAQRARKEYATALIERIAQWRSVYRQHHRVNDHAAAYELYATVEKQLQELQPQLTQYRATQTTILNLKEQLNKLKEQLVLYHAQNQQTLVTEQAKLQSSFAYQTTHLQELQNTVTKESVELETIRVTISQANSKLIHYDKVLAEQPALEAQFERRKQTYHRWLEHGKALQTQLRELTEKKDQLNNTTCSTCPLCLQNLSDTTRTFVVTSFEQQHTIITRSIKRLSLVIPALKQILMDQHVALKQLTVANQERALIHNRCADFEQTRVKKEAIIADCKAKIEKLSAENILTKNELEQQTKELASLGSLELILTSNESYQKLTQQLENQLVLLKQLGMVENEYMALTEKLKTLDAQRKQYEKLMHDIALQQERSQEIKKISRTISRIDLELIQQANLLQTLPQVEQTVTQLQQQKQQTEQTRNVLVSKKETVAHTRGALEHQKNLLEKKELELQKFQERLIALDQTINDYQAINQALGKDGIQALLIEEALPDIEQEANAILGKLTDNQAHIIIESLRDLKSGSTKETLDIKISDSLGIRPYEMFSGGEAFRIDFALRIAISKLLTRRAGATMQLLVIDEGFGSQDEEGLAHIMDMLYKIQDSFAKIVIVSHLPMLKEQFPVHFMIQKTTQGSSISIVQNG